MYETGMCEYAEPSFIREVELANDRYPLQWGLNNTGQSGGTPGIDINAEQAWTITRGSTNIKVAVMDTGVDLTHPDLQANIWGGYDCAASGAPGGTNGGPWMAGSSGNAHGTQSAGIIGAINNTIGVVGVASNCKIVPIRYGWIPNGSSFYATSDPGVASGFRYAWETAKVDVVHNGWGNGGASSETTEAISNAMTLGRNGKGCVVVFCSHNQGLNYVPDPQGSEPRYLVVGNMTRTGARASSSNYGTALDVVAPGREIMTTDWKDGYSSPSGTSFAGPHVAGVAALILSVNPNLTAKQVADIIESTAQKVGVGAIDPNGQRYNYQTTSGRPNGTWDNKMGYGLVDAYRAVQKASYSLSLPQISGPELPYFDVQCSYNIPTTLPPGVTFNGWSISPSSGYTVSGGLNNRNLNITFSTPADYTVSANLILPDSTPFAVTKTVHVSSEPRM